MLTTLPAPSSAATAKRVWPMMLVLLTGVFIAQFDFFVVNVAAPSIARDLHASATQLELVVGGYAFAYAAGMITSGRLGDSFGHRRLFAIGVVAFGVTSLLCGVAPSAGALVGFRLLQGLAGSIMLPQTMGMITREFPGDSRAKALGAWGMAAGLGSIAGQVLGGLLVQIDVAGLGWRLIFLVNVPICLLTAALCRRTLPPPAGIVRRSLDLPGALGTIATLGLFLVPLTLGRAEGWPLWGWSCMAGAVLVGVHTLRRQVALTRNGGSPVLDTSLFAVRSFTLGLIACVAFMLYFGSFMFVLTVFLQSGLRQDALQAGLVFCPQGVFFSVTSLMGSRLRARFGRKALVLACAVTGLGLTSLGVALVLSGGDLAVGWVGMFLCLVGAGNGVVLPALVGAALTEVPVAQAGVANGVLQTAQQFANSSGVALLGAVFFAVLGTGAEVANYARAMTWSAALDLVLVLVVALSFRSISSARVRDR